MHIDVLLLYFFINTRNILDHGSPQIYFLLSMNCQAFTRNSEMNSYAVLHCELIESLICSYAFVGYLKTKDILDCKNKQLLRVNIAFTVFREWE